LLIPSLSFLLYTMPGEGGTSARYYDGRGRGESRGAPRGYGRGGYRGDHRGGGRGFFRGAQRGFRGSRGYGRGRGRGFGGPNDGRDSRGSNESESRASDGRESRGSNESESRESGRSNSRGSGHGGADYVESKELACKTFQIQSKRYYIDVKENKRGKFIKAAEVAADGRRNQIFLSLSTAAEFRDQLSSFGEFYAGLGPQNAETAAEDGKLKEAVIVKDNRRYFLDLKENDRGRFLKVSQTIRGGPRSQIAIPALGMVEWRDNLAKLLEEFGTEDGGEVGVGELPEGRFARVENKSFYFDIGQNHRGVFMRISEVKNNFRTNITIPKDSWEGFRDIFDDYVVKMKEAVEEVEEKQ